MDVPYNYLSEGFLFTDQYELTMARFYFSEGLDAQEIPGRPVYGVLRPVNPRLYHASLSQRLRDLKQGLIAKARA